VLIRKFATTLALTLAAHAPAAAHGDHTDIKAGDLTIEAPWVRASAPGQTNGAGYMTLHHHGKQDDRLLSVQSDAAERVELHTVVTENGMARMRQVDGVTLAAGQETALAPGGYHIMFLKLKAPFQAGEMVAATLQFERAGAVPIRFTVQPTTYHPNGQTRQRDTGHHLNHDHGDHAHRHGTKH